MTSLPSLRSPALVFILTYREPFLRTPVVDGPNGSRPSLSPFRLDRARRHFFKATCLITAFRAQLAGPTALLRCDQPSRFISYSPRNPRFHSFRHQTHWHSIASYRIASELAFYWSFLDPVPKVAHCIWSLHLAQHNISSVYVPMASNLSLEGLVHDTKPRDYQIHLRQTLPCHRRIIQPSLFRFLDAYAPFGLAYVDFLSTTVPVRHLPGH